MKSSPAFQFYPSDWLGSMRVQLFTLEQEGAYLRLLCYCWIHGSIPNDVEKCKSLIGKSCINGASTINDISLVMSMFRQRGAVLVHDRLEAERRKQTEWREKSAQGGKISARKRASQVTDVHNNDEGWFQNGTNQKATLQSSSSSSSSDNTPLPPLRGMEVEFPGCLKTPEFETAWRDWLAYRRERRLPIPVERSLKSQFHKLESWGHNMAIESIRQSIERTWAGLFEPKAKLAPQGSTLPPARAAFDVDAQLRKQRAHA